MPELPEVETTRLGLVRRVQGKLCTNVVVRERRFRKPPPADMRKILVGQRLIEIRRRGKYLIWIFEHGALVSHLGMSGVLRVVPIETEPVKHDHIDICFGDIVVRYHDPRRFGFMIWLPEEENPEDLPELQRLGIEPFSEELTAPLLKKLLKNTSVAVKEALLSGKYIVGAGNIYCSESLYAAGISPFVPANRISEARLAKLINSVRNVLELSLKEGGATLKDFVSAEGEKGYFTLHAQVYGKEGEPCPRCSSPIKKAMQGGRATYYCSVCQRR